MCIWMPSWVRSPGQTIVKFYSNLSAYEALRSTDRGALTNALFPEWVAAQTRPHRTKAPSQGTSYESESLLRPVCKRHCFEVVMQRLVCLCFSGPNNTAVYPDSVDLSGYDIDGFRDVAIKAGWEEVRLHVLGVRAVSNVMVDPG